MSTREFQIDVAAGTWSEAEWVGDELVPVEVTYLPGDVTHIVCPVYYSREGVLELKVTRDTEQALRMMVALLREDNLIEDEK